MDAQTESKLDPFILLQTAIEVSQRSKNSQTSPYCSLGVIFMCLGIAKIHQEPITQELGNVSIIALDNLCTGGLVGTNDFPVLFGVKLRRKLGGIDQVAEHDRELASFSFGCMRGHDRRYCFGGWGGLGRRRGDGRGRLSRYFDSPFNSTCPHETSALIIDHRVRVEEFFLQRFKSLVIQVELGFERSIGRPPSLLEEGDHPVEDVIEVHYRPSSSSFNNALASLRSAVSKPS